MAGKFKARRGTRVLGWAIIAAFHAVGISFAGMQRGTQCGTQRSMQRSMQRMQYPGQLHLPCVGNKDLKKEKALPMRESKKWQTTQTERVRTGHARIPIDFASWSLLGGVLLLWSLGAYTFLTALLKRCAQCHLGVQQCLHLSKMASGSWIF